MNFKDQITGEILSKLPKEIESGRYSVLNDEMLNNHTQLHKEDILFSDGGSICKLSSSKHVFQKIDKTDELTIDAILTINELMEHQVDDNISPLLPSSFVGKEIDKLPLEIRLDESIKQGHLHHISYKPRMDLKYDEAVIDVSRARRLSNGTLKHLASHSECWQRRTLTGVIPRKILARFSEDDYGLYENHLYASLLDKLENHLQARLIRLIQLHEELSNALAFQSDNNVYHKLSHNICSLWGKTYDAEQTDKQLKASEDIRQFLEASLRTIKGLKQKGLYTQVQYKKHINYLYRTNILKHDPHYQRLPSLWEDIQKEASTLKPEEIFLHRKKIHNAYLQYIGLVIYSALKKYDFSKSTLSFSWTGKEIKLKDYSDRWILSNATGEALELIVWASNTLPDMQQQPKVDQVICYFSSHERENIKTYSSLTGVISVTPLDLYVVERIGTLIDQWLIRQAIDLYAKKISALPNCLYTVIEKYPEIERVNNGIRIIKPLAHPKRLLEDIEPLDINNKTQKEIKSQILLIQELSKCPICCKKTNTFGSNTKGFYAECDNCDGIWSYDGSKYDQYIKGEKDKVFTETGRFRIGFPCSC